MRWLLAAALIFSLVATPAMARNPGQGRASQYHEYKHHQNFGSHWSGGGAGKSHKYKPH